MRRRGTLALAAQVALSVSWSCGAPDMPGIVSPPPFVYVERREINNVMWRFASGVAALDQALGSRTGDAPDTAAVITALRDLDESASHLPIATATNHPMLAQQAERFRRDIARALSDAEAVQPDVTLARRIPGACLYCHALADQ